MGGLLLVLSDLARDVKLGDRHPQKLGFNPKADESNPTLKADVQMPRLLVVEAVANALLLQLLERQFGCFPNGHNIVAVA